MEIEHHRKNDPYTVCKDELWCEMYSLTQGNLLHARSQSRKLCDSISYVHRESKNCATFIFTVTLANVGRFLKFFQCRNQKEMAHNKNEKFSTAV